VASPLAPARDLDAGHRAIPTLSRHTADACQRLAADREKPTDGNPAGFSASPNFSHFSFAVWLLLVYNQKQKGGESMKIKVNVRAGGLKGIRS